VNRLRLARVGAGDEHEEVGVVAHASHVEDGDVRRELLAADGGDAVSQLEWGQSRDVRVREAMR
jgi:hypothetical protein